MKNLYIFILGLFSITEISIAGFNAPAAIIFLIPIVPYFIRDKFKSIYYKKIKIFLFMLLIGYVLSDIYNSVEIESTIKTVLKAAVMFIYFPLAYWALKDNPNRILYYLIGYGISGILQFFIFPAADYEARVLSTDTTSAMEFSGAWFIRPIFIATASICYYYGKRKIAILIIEIFAVYAIFNNSRWPFASFTIIAMLLLYFGQINEENVEAIKTKFKSNIKKVLIVASVGFIISVNGYEYLAENNFLDERSTEKYYKAKEVKTFGLASGRVDFFGAAYAVLREPIWGYGTTPHNKNHVNQDFASLANYYPFKTFNYIPTHSHILGAWVTAGFLGIFFFMYLINIIVVYVKKCLLYNYKYLAFSLLFISEYLWDILFSPYSGARGYRLSFIFVFFILMIHKFDKRHQKSSELTTKNIEHETF